MDPNRFTEKSREAIHESQTLSIQYGNINVDVEHLLLALIKQENGLIPRLYTKMEIPLENFESELISIIQKFPKQSGSLSPDSIYITQRLQNLFIIAEEEARQVKDEYVSVEHLHMAMLEEKSDSNLGKLFKTFSIDKDRFLKTLSTVRGNQRVRSANPEDTYEALERYGQELVNAARLGKLEPVIGRDSEIRSVIRILSRKTKNNPVLIGEPGVGKTAIVEGLAHRIVRGDVPESLKNKKIFSLDIGSLIAGAKFRGEFEERLKSVLAEVKDSAGEILMFIDEMHTIVGAGKVDGALDAGNMLKPMLARGELHCIGATTLDEYRKHVEKDAALERRFQPVKVEAPNVQDTISILRGLKERFEIHHGVKIQDKALVASAVLSNRYISDRFLPDKAIDLIDEACAMIRTEIDSLPTELDEVSRRVMQLEIEDAALSKEKDAASKERLGNIKRELADLRETERSMKAQWQNEKEAITEVQALREEIENIKAQIEKAERDYDLNLLARLKHGSLPEAQNRLKAKESREEENKSSRLLREEVTEEEVAEVVSKWSGIPVQKLVEGEREKLLKLEDILHKRVIGQDEAVSLVSDAIIRARAGIKDPGRPVGSFIFLGPTGVGKTELAKTLAQTLFDTEENMIRIDMSEYMERHSVSRLIGAPPGYVGFEEGGQLTEAVRRKPYSVILFDEIEKAHSDVFNVLLQILDDGRITDSQGRTVNFKNTVLIMTSNIGSTALLEGITDSGEIKDETKKQVMGELRRLFRPEFLNRVDDTVLFRPLTLAETVNIVKLMVEELQKRLSDRRINLEITDPALEFIAREGFDPVYGARPLKRFIQHELETRIGRSLIEGNIFEGNTLSVQLEAEKLKVVIEK